MTVTVGVYRAGFSPEQREQEIAESITPWRIALILHAIQ